MMIKPVILILLLLVILWTFLSLHRCHGSKQSLQFKFTPQRTLEYAETKKSPLAITTKLGIIHGTRDMTYPNIRLFLGVPYAQPPIGKLRWKKPEMMKPWKGMLIAHSFGPVCPQYEFFLDQSEDCLHLNIYTSATSVSSKKMPVIVYFYGGGFSIGGNSEHKIYDGSYIVQNKQVLFVSVSYRIGPFGFLTTSNATEGNLGLFDQQLAIRWVYENIDAFGGDKKRISLWGQSAGALSVLIHINSNIVNKGIAQSPPIGLKFHTKEHAMRVGNKFATSLGCDSDENRLECLHSLSTWDIMNPTKMLFPSGFDLPWYPHIDGDIIKSEELSITSKPLLIGYTQNELFLAAWVVERIVFLTTSLGIKVDVPEWLGNGLSNVHYVTVIYSIFPIRKAWRILAKFPPSNNPKQNHDNFWQLMSDTIFKCAILNYTTHLPTVYLYSFNFKTEYLSLLGGDCAKEKVCHAHELPYSFHSSTQLITFTPREHQLSDFMIDYWVQFINDDGGSVGSYVDFDGNLVSRPKWELFSRRRQRIMMINDTWKMATYDADSDEICRLLK